MKSNINRIIFIVSMLLIAAIAIILLINVLTIKPTITLQLGDGVFSARTALTDASRQQGLSGVTNLPSDQALLIAFPSDGEWQIWMKDMKIPLDIVWLNSDKKVVYIVRDATPEDSTNKIFTPNSLTRYVVEVPAGTVRADNIAIDGTANFVIDESQVQ